MPGFETRQAAEEGRPEGAGHLRAVLQRRQGAGGEPARRRAAGKPRLHLPDGAAALGAAADRHRRGGQRAGRRSTAPCAYVKERKVFGQAVASLPEHALQAGRDADRGADRARLRRPVHSSCCCEGKLDTATASMAKYWCSDLQCKVIDECVQLHGGYGYMWEYPIARAYADARVQRIYGGTNEIMKEVISRSMGLGGALMAQAARAAAPRAGRAVGRARRRTRATKATAGRSCCAAPRGCSATRVLPPPPRATSPPRPACSRARPSITSRARRRCCSR